MRPEKPDENLDKVLRQWKVNSSLPPRFQERVWSRIEKEGNVPSPFEFFLNWVSRKFARPALAGAYVAVLIFSGIAAGFWQAQSRSDLAKSQLETRYFQMVDPYQAPR